MMLTLPEWVQNRLKERVKVSCRSITVAAKNKVNFDLPYILVSELQI